MQIIHPKDEQEWLDLRTKDITSTEIGSLFGISPYMTAFELWHRKKNDVRIQIDGNERMFWGTLLQDSIADGIVKQGNNWVIQRMKEYIRDEKLKIGASFDFSIALPGDVPITSERLGLLEIKNVDGLVFRNEWTETEAPLHIEIQVQHQLLVSQREFAYIGALVGGNRLVLIKREPDFKVHQAIIDKVTYFWHSIENNIEPKPNMEVDAEFVSKMYGYSEPGKVINLNDPGVKLQAQRYKEAGDKIKELDTVRDVIKAEMLMQIGDAEKALGDDFTISAGMVGPSTYTVERKGYRNFRINFKKEK